MFTLQTMQAIHPHTSDAIRVITRHLEIVSDGVRISHRGTSEDVRDGSFADLCIWHTDQADLVILVVCDHRLVLTGFPGAHPCEAFGTTAALEFYLEGIFDRDRMKELI